MAKICPRCHKKNPDDALWCKNCKYRLVRHIGLEDNIKKPEKSDPAITQGKMPFFIREEKKTRKKIGLIIVIIALILIIPTSYLLYVGIIQSPEDAEFEKFIGKWISTDNNSTILKFNKNGTCIFKNINASFEIRKGSIRNDEPNKMILEIKEQKTNQSEVYTFEFNDQNDRLTLAKVLAYDETAEKEKYRKIKS